MDQRLWRSSALRRAGRWQGESGGWLACARCATGNGRAPFGRESAFHRFRLAPLGRKAAATWWGLEGLCLGFQGCEMRGRGGGRGL